MTDFLRMLKDLGFTEYEARAYVALAMLGPSTAKEISDESKLPRNKTYEVLRNLEKEGRVVSLPLSPRKYKIADIAILDERIRQKKEEARTLEGGLKDFVAFLSKPKRESKEVMWVIKGQHAILEKIAAEMDRVKSETVAIVRSSKDYLPGLKATENAVKRGVRSRILGIVSRDNYHVVKKWIEAGVEFRAYDEKRFGPTGMRFGVFDKKTVRITIGKPEISDPEEYITLWIESPSLANALRQHFLNLWRAAEPAEKVIKRLEAENDPFRALR